MITHVVLLGLIDATDCPEALNRLRALPAQIPEILTLRCGQALADAGGTSTAPSTGGGTSTAPSTGGGTSTAPSTGGGTSLVLITEHNDEAALDAYQDHPVHREFLAWVRPRLATRSAVDTDDLR